MYFAPQLSFYLVWRNLEVSIPGIFIKLTLKEFLHFENPGTEMLLIGHKPTSYKMWNT